MPSTSSPEFDPELASRIREATQRQLERHVSAPNSLFTRLPDDPATYRGQAPEDFYVEPKLPHDRDRLYEAMSEFCPNTDEILTEQMDNIERWRIAAEYVRAGYRLIAITNHRMLADVALYGGVQTYMLSQPELLGPEIVERSSLAIHKLVSGLGYGEKEIPAGEQTIRVPRSAIEVLQDGFGLDLVLPGSQSTRRSEITREDKADINAPVLNRWRELRESGDGFVTTFAGSGSEDWRIQAGDHAWVIQQTLSPGTIDETMHPKTVVLPVAVVFDRLFNAHLRFGEFQTVKNRNNAHQIMRDIATMAEELSGERTLYINDHNVLEQIGKLRQGVRSIGTYAAQRGLELLNQYRDGDEATEPPAPVK